MCGIAGVMWWDERIGDRAAAATAAMGRRVAHRGPDGHGQWQSPRPAPVGASFAHTRLAIIDLTEGGAQPMARADHVITYNGEIYNHREVRRELEALGTSFTTDSDTEVLLRAWDRWGSNCLDRLTGMFAFAVWDVRRQGLTLVRDRFGIKPLYLASFDGGLAFASEVRALVDCGLVRGRIDRSSVPHYLAHQTAPTPKTLVEDVAFLPPASITTVGADGRRDTRTYWDLLSRAGTADCTSRSAALAGVRERLDASIRDHFVSDVPVGMFLSGGLDSNALLSAAASAGPLPRTFTIALDDDGLDESELARNAAAAFGSEHTECRVTAGEALACLPEFLSAIDHPSGDGLNTFIISRAVRARGMTVAWSGLGGDELYGGYPSFRRLPRALSLLARWRQVPTPVRSAAAELVRRGAPATVVATKVAEAVGGDGTLATLWPVTRQLYGARDRERLLGRPATPDAYVRLLAEAVERWPGASLGALISFAETRAYMHDVLLRDADQMSMAHGLEVRVPLLDHRLAEFVVGLPDGIRLAGERPKSLLTDSLERPLPAGLLARSKRGFSLPFDRWMRTALRPTVERHLGPEGLAGRGVFEPRGLASVWADYLAGRRGITWARIWMLVALDAWLEHTGVTTA